MPLIPQVQEQVREFTRAPEAAQHPQLERAQGEAAANLGHAMEHLGSELMMAQHHKDSIDASNAAADWQMAAQAGIQNIKSGHFLPDDVGDEAKGIPVGAKTVQSFQDGLHDAADQIRSRDNLSDGAKAQFTEMVNKLYVNKYHPEAFAETAKNVYGQIQEQNDSAINKRAQMAYTDPNMYPDAIHDAVQIVANSPFEGEMKRKQTESAFHKINESMLGGFAQRGQYDEARAFMQRPDVNIDPDQAKQWNQTLNEKQKQDTTFAHEQAMWRQQQDDRALKQTSEHIFSSALLQLNTAKTQGEGDQINRVMLDAMQSGAVRKEEYDAFAGLRSKLETTPNDAAITNDRIFGPVLAGKLSVDKAQELLSGFAQGANPLMSQKGVADATMKLQQLGRLQSADPVYQDAVREAIKRVTTAGLTGDAATRALNGVFDNDTEKARVSKDTADLLTALDKGNMKLNPLALADSISARGRGLENAPAYRGVLFPLGVSDAASRNKIIMQNEKDGMYNSPAGQKILKSALRDNEQDFINEKRKRMSETNAWGK